MSLVLAVLSRRSCPGVTCSASPIMAVLLCSLLCASHFGYPVLLDVLFRLPFSDCPLLFVLHCLSYYSSPVPAALSGQSCPGSPVLVALSWQSFYGSLFPHVLVACPILVVPFWLSCSNCSVLTVLFCLSSRFGSIHACLIVSIFCWHPYPDCSCPGSPILAVLFCLYDLPLSRVSCFVLDVFF